MLSHMAAFAASLTSAHLSFHVDGFMVLRDKDISRTPAEFWCKMTEYISGTNRSADRRGPKGPSQAV